MRVSVSPVRKKEPPPLIRHVDPRIVKIEIRRRLSAA
jgi:hypothetical protein